MNGILIQKSRIRPLNDNPVKKGAFVLYWMQQSQRAEYNHALEYAIEMANHFDLPVKVIFALAGDYPEANLRHYTFMMEGLVETRDTLRRRGIHMEAHIGDPASIVVKASENAAALICDYGYLRHQKSWRRAVARQAPCRVVQVESDAVVPVAVASEKAEYGAYTIRPRINRLLEAYLVDIPHQPVRRPLSEKMAAGFDLYDYKNILEKMRIDKSVLPVSGRIHGGTSLAKRAFDVFLKNRLMYYDRHANQPQTEDVSFMGPYLHFGQVSPLYLALTLNRMEGVLQQAKDRFLEQLIIRRELSINYVVYCPEYDSFDGLPGWAKITLGQHREDRRTYLYSEEQLESAKTHDSYWNAAMLEMKTTGYMHNYMRMYWAKKILEWSDSPRQAHQTTLMLNNRYFLDGRDPNSYAGVSWAYGLHDRPWKERPVFGKIRYMAASGLERKCDIQAYVAKVKQIPLSGK